MLEVTLRKPGRPFGSKNKAIERQVAEHFQDIEHLFVAAPKHHGDLIEQHRKPMSVSIAPLSSGWPTVMSADKEVCVVHTGNCLQIMPLRDFNVGRQFSPHWRAPSQTELHSVVCVRA